MTANEIGLLFATNEIGLLFATLVVSLSVAAFVAYVVTKRMRKRKTTPPRRSLPPAWWRYDVVGELLKIHADNCDGQLTWRDCSGPFAAIMSKARAQQDKEFEELDHSGGLDTLWLRRRIDELQEIYKESASAAGNTRTVEFTERTVATLSRTLVDVAACMGADLADVLGSPIFKVDPWTPTEFPGASVEGRTPKPAAEEQPKTNDSPLPMHYLEKDKWKNGKLVVPFRTVREIVGDHLKRYGLDGLMSKDRRCACRVELWISDDARPNPPSDCRPEDCTAGFIGPDRREESPWAIYPTKESRDAAREEEARKSRAE